MNNEFTKITQDNITRYILESDSGTTTAGSVATVPGALGKVRKRGDNILAQEADKKTVPASTPRNFVAKNAKTGGAGAHKDKKKAEKQGDVKHRKPFAEQGVAVTEGFMDTIKKGYNKTVNALGNIGIMPPELLSPRRDANGNWNKRTNEPRNNFIHWLGGNPALEPHADELLASFDKWVDDGNSDRDAGKHAKDEWQQRMKATKQQGVAEGFNGEYDDEAGMAQSNLLTTARAVMGLLKTIKDRDNLPEWGQEKIAKAEMMLVSVWDYLQSQKAMGNDPQQDIAEGERTMSRAAKGYEKYGKKGMQALAKAGRDDASDEKLNTIRNKHNKYDEGEDPYFESLRARVEELAKK